jgi:hypothetical protein
VDRWPHIFDTVIAVKHIGWDGTGERVRFSGTFGDRRGSWVSSRELNPKRLQLRFRQEHAPHPLASLGGLWLVVPKGAGSLVVLDHYYTVVNDDPALARRLDKTIARNAVGLLAALRRAAETGDTDGTWLAVPEGVTSR